MIAEVIAQAIAEVVGYVVVGNWLNRAVDKALGKQPPEPSSPMVHKREAVKQRRQWRRLLDWQ
jgi:hypothetical protein